MNEHTLPTGSPQTPRSRDRLLVGLVAGGLLVAALGAGAGWLLRGTSGKEGAVATAPAEPVAPVTPPVVAAPPQAAVVPPPPVSTVRAKPAPVHSRPAPGDGQAPVAAERPPLDTRPVVATCQGCGTIEGVRSVEHKGEGSGVGAVAGGVLGAVVGNQVGGGNGRKAMTVLGALGGGMAGHEIEKRRNSETVYEVRVRLDDGSVRTLTQKTAPSPGARVVVEGSTLRYLRAGDQGA